MQPPRLTLPRHVLVATLPRLLRELQPAWGLAATVTRADRIEFLLPRLEVSAEPPVAWRTPGEHQLPFIVRAGSDWRAPETWDAWLGTMNISHGTLGLVALIADGEALGWVHGEVWRPIGEFHWPGPGMERTRVPVPAGSEDDAGDQSSERDSRLAGALSKPVLSRLRNLAFVVVGVSRVGSLVAHSLARWGVRRIALIDPDAVEPHNADAGEFDLALDEGKPKVKAVARALARLPPASRRVDQINQRLLAPLAFSAAREADVIISCVDDDGARLVASTIAASHLRIHLDIGVQVNSDDTGGRTAGADIRLILPEDPPGCLACFGGFARPDALRRAAGFDTSPPLAWNEVRAGSLRTVNQIAAHLGLRLIERLVSGEVSRSTWLRYEDAPLPTLREIVPRRSWTCPLCFSYLGLGDAIYQDRDLHLRRLVRAIAGVRQDSGASQENG